MRKLKLQMQMTIDGFVGGKDGEMDWMKGEPDSRQLGILQSLTDNMDTILMGRKMAGAFTSYWENVADNEPDSPEHLYARIFTDTPKVVFSRTTLGVPGRNVRVENGDLRESVTRLKSTTGKDLIVYGGANFVSGLIEHHLIDELYLFINPVTIGEGLKIFTGRFDFELVNSTTCGNGVIANQYKPAGR